MNGSPRRWDTWAQWAAVILTLLTFGWDLSARLERIETTLIENSDTLSNTINKVNTLQQQLTDHLIKDAAHDVPH